MSLRATAGYRKMGSMWKVVMLFVFVPLGGVYGDLATSFFYALDESRKHFGDSVDAETVLGMLSCFFWTLLLLPGVLYALIVICIHNHGHGGVLAFYALAQKANYGKHGWLKPLLSILLIIGMGLIVSDGIFTPPISISPPVEHWVKNHGFDQVYPYAAPLITSCIIAALFLLQPLGLSRISILFGPIVLIWLSSYAVIGGEQVSLHPEVFKAMNPWYAAHFLVSHPHGTIVGFLGSLFLCTTGVEAMSADRGPVGAKPIVLTWFLIVWPCLVLGYFGQGAFLLSHGDLPSEKQLFFATMQTSAFGFLPQVVGVLSPIVSVIASQALLIAVFTVAEQAMNLGQIFRLRVRYTNPTSMEQNYVPAVNWVLMVACIVVTLVYQSADRMAHAYGLSISVMINITIFVASVLLWLSGRVRWWLVLPLFLCFEALALGFTYANVQKFKEGGWVTLLIAGAVYYVVYVWRWGRTKIRRAYEEFAGESRMKDLIGFRLQVQSAAGRLVTPYGQIVETDTAATYLSSSPVMGDMDKVPALLLADLCRRRSIPKHLTILHFQSKHVPVVDCVDQTQMEVLKGATRCLTVPYGFMQVPDSDHVIDRDILRHSDRWSIVVGNEQIYVDPAAPWYLRFKMHLFSRMLTIQWKAHRYFFPGRMCELDSHIDEVIIPVVLTADGKAHVQLPRFNLS